ncbi:hypothetical protein [Terrabacter koreensis]
MTRARVLIHPYARTRPPTTRVRVHQPRAYASTNHARTRPPTTRVRVHHLRTYVPTGHPAPYGSMGA